MRQTERYDEAAEILSQTLEDVTGLELERMRQSPKENLLEICSVSGELFSEKAVAIADLLLEDGMIQEDADDDAKAILSRQRALWLYEAAHSSGGVIPLDLPNKLEKLKALLQNDQHRLS